MDMRLKLRFPNPPTSKEEIYDPSVPAWHLACALVGDYSSYTYNTYRKFFAILEEERFRDILDITRIIFAESGNIRNRPAFLNAQFAAALSLGGL